MKHIFGFDIRTYTDSWGILAALTLVAMGVFAGLKFNFHVGEAVYLNSPYTIRFMCGMLSLAIVFIATPLAIHLLFREADSGMAAIVYTLPIGKRELLCGRMMAFLALTFVGFLLLVCGFAIGQLLRTGVEFKPGFYPFHYAYPLLIFGAVNTLFICSVLCLAGWSSRSKPLVAVTGVWLFIGYFIALLFSNSPLMALSFPQSLAAERISSLVDPFGLSAYFSSSKAYTVVERNTSVVALRGLLLANRIFIAGFSMVAFFAAYYSFSFSSKGVRRGASVPRNSSVGASVADTGDFAAATVNRGEGAWLKAVFSFAKVELRVLFGSIPLLVAAAGLLFYMGMELYGEIEKGIRLPQLYATSGLVATTICNNFHSLMLVLLVYFINDSYWKSASVRFLPLENATMFAGGKRIAHWLSANVMLVALTGLITVEGLLFQWAYNYPRLDVLAYIGVWVFNTGPLMVSAGLLVLINHWSKHKYLALCLSFVFAWFTAGPFAGWLVSFPLLRFQSGFAGEYSDLNGYGAYLPAFGFRLAFGACVVWVLWLLAGQRDRRRSLSYRWLLIVVLVVLGGFSAARFMEGYEPQADRREYDVAAAYEKQYRKYQSIAQPTVTQVRTEIELFPSKRTYTVSGSYSLKNVTTEPIHQVLLNFSNKLAIKGGRFISASDTVDIDIPVTELHLSKPLLPQDTACLVFKIAYRWMPVNGHDPANAIIGNGSFMRISRYFPSIGYQADQEISDMNERKRFKLGDATAPANLEAPKSPGNDFILLDMVVSTEAPQTAVGVGELVRQWYVGGRNYFQYRTNEPIPFRFAVSSAEYAIKQLQYRGKDIVVYYHPTHEENVASLLRNAQATLAYCEQNFGPCPFQSIHFAEVSSFTRGFSATAYPNTIFMVERPVFHANVQADEKQDVINELAGHELSHLWWGNNRISPDVREGATLLTESLAMYTEMMLYKRMYGKAKMLERLKLQSQLYESQHGFTEEQPLYRVTAENIHVSYAKGALVMYLLYDLLGEDTVNQALRDFLVQHQYPNSHPTSLDLLAAFYNVTPIHEHDKITRWFKEPGLPKELHDGLK